ncbi:MAG: HIT family protein, partial [Planctomycetota bacterium]
MNYFSLIGRLWSPWRKIYVKSIGKNKKCFLCQELKNVKKSSLIVKVGGEVFTILNKYPYNAGHLMIAPKRHKGNIEDILLSEWEEMHTQIIEAKKALDKLLKPNGYNIGINLGRAGGAGLLNHLHIHIVPRWQGDTNFMTVLSD